MIRSDVSDENESPIHSIAVDENKRFIFCGDENGDVRKFDLEFGSHQQFKAHRESVRDIGLAHDGNTIITGSQDNTVAAFDAETLIEKWRYRCSSYTGPLAIIENEVFVSVAYFPIICLDASTGNLKRTFEEIIGGSIVFMAVAPRG